MQQIKKDLKQAIEQYINDQWVNYRKRLIYPEAKENLLGGASLHFYKSNSTAPVNIHSDKEFKNALCNPVVADKNGNFVDIHINQDHRYVLKSRTGEPITAKDNICNK